MNHSNQPWRRLVTAARRTHDERVVTAPYGFATRVAARAFGAPVSTSLFFERFALRAVGFACLLAVLAIATNYSQLQSASQDDESLFATDDPAAILIDVS